MLKEQIDTATQFWERVSAVKTLTGSQTKTLMMNPATNKQQQQQQQQQQKQQQKHQHQHQQQPQHL